MTIPATVMADFHFDHFIEAQHGVYGSALAELKAGAKRTHWMWYIFPQLGGLGRSKMADYFALGGTEAAAAYLAHPALGPRLRDCTAAMLLNRATSAEAILGPVDAMKFRSCMTLFEAAGGGALFAEALEVFYGGERDLRTLELLRH